MPPVTAPESPADIAAARCGAADEPFAGRYRAAAKTSLARHGQALAPVETLAGLEALRDYLRPVLDPRMRLRHPHLEAETSAEAPRVAEEQHLLTVRAYLHAVKHEGGAHGDHDFHVMLGSSAVADAGIFFTAEVSGLPSPGARDYPELAAARRQLLALLGRCVVGERFVRIDPPLAVQVTGALFFDADHSIGAVGPAYAKPFTVWELHPVLRIERASEAPP
ncbi:MAG: hypothetical protein JSR73_18855 [Proteobacteria bacterium]|nr:hypothetical protein [Pseudomonadota bacterium]